MVFIDIELTNLENTDSPGWNVAKFVCVAEKELQNLALEV